jgi:hypothetical protein
MFHKKIKKSVSMSLSQLTSYTISRDTKWGISLHQESIRPEHISLEINGMLRMESGAIICERRSKSPRHQIVFILRPMEQKSMSLYLDQFVSMSKFADKDELYDFKLISENLSLKVDGVWKPVDAKNIDQWEQSATSDLDILKKEIAKMDADPKHDKEAYLKLQESLTILEQELEFQKKTHPHEQVKKSMISRLSSFYKDHNGFLGKKGKKTNDALSKDSLLKNKLLSRPDKAEKNFRAYLKSEAQYSIGFEELAIDQEGKAELLSIDKIAREDNADPSIHLMSGKKDQAHQKALNNETCFIEDKEAIEGSFVHDNLLENMNLNSIDMDQKQDAYCIGANKVINLANGHDLKKPATTSIKTKKLAVERHKTKSKKSLPIKNKKVNVVKAAAKKIKKSKAAPLKKTFSKKTKVNEALIKSDNSAEDLLHLKNIQVERAVNKFESVDLEAVNAPSIADDALPPVVETQKILYDEIDTLNEPKCVNEVQQFQQQISSAVDEIEPDKLRSENIDAIEPLSIADATLPPVVETEHKLHDDTDDDLLTNLKGAGNVQKLKQEEAAAVEEAVPSTFVSLEEKEMLAKEKAQIQAEKDAEEEKLLQEAKKIEEEKSQIDLQQQATDLSQAESEQPEAKQEDLDDDLFLEPLRKEPLTQIDRDQDDKAA